MYEPHVGSSEDVPANQQPTQAMSQSLPSLVLPPQIPLPLLPPNTKWSPLLSLGRLHLPSPGRRVVSSCFFHCLLNNAVTECHLLRLPVNGGVPRPQPWLSEKHRDPEPFDHPERHLSPCIPFSRTSNSVMPRTSACRLSGYSRTPLRSPHNDTPSPIRQGRIDVVHRRS